MKLIDVQTQHIRDLLYPIVGETTAKTYFSYYGIVKDNIMFALYKNNNFYLQLSKSCLPEALQHSHITLLSDEQSRIHSKTFYFIPPDIINNLDKYSHWVIQSIQEIREYRETQYIKKKQNIRALPNMNVQFERTLKKIGINSPNDLVQYGEINTFIKLLKVGIDVDQTMLFKLYGAIKHQYIYTLSEQEKENLLNEVNNALYDAGLRKRFKIKS